MNPQSSRRMLLKGAASTVSFAFLAQRATAQSTPRRISFGETRTGEIDSGDPEYQSGYNAEPWKFDAETGDEVELAVSADTLSGLQYWFEDPEGTLVYHSSSSGNWLTHAIALAHTGPYTFWVGPYPENHTGTYSLTLSKRGENHLLAPGDSFTETLSAGDIDWGHFATGSGVEPASAYFDLYLVQGTAGQTVSVSLESSEFTPKLAVAPLYTASYDATVAEGSGASLSHEFTEDGSIEIVVTAVEDKATGQYTLAVAEGDRSSISANVGPQPPVTISDYPYLETMQILWDGEPYDGVSISADREQLSETSYRVLFAVEQVAGAPIDYLGGYGYSQILVVLSNVDIEGDELQASVNGGTPVALVAGDVVITIASGGIKDLILHPIKELAKTVVEEAAMDAVTSRLQFNVPPDVETVDDVTVLQIDFSDETHPYTLSPRYFEQFELEIPLSVAEASGEPSVSIIPDIRGQTIGQPTDNRFTGTIGTHLPIEYRRQLLLTFPTSEQVSTDSTWDVVEHSLCTDVQDAGDNYTAQCIGGSSTFFTTDQRIYSLIQFEDAPLGLTLGWEWYTPTGERYIELSETNDEGAAFEAWCYIDVEGHRAAYFPGDWSVKTIINGGEVTLTQYFTLQ